MKRTLLVLALFTIGAAINPARGQTPAFATLPQTPESANIPWNNTLMVVRADPAFQSIAVPIIQGAQHLTVPVNGVVDVPLPFRFRFLGEMYNENDILHVGIKGFVSFNQATSATPISGPYSLLPGPVNSTPAEAYQKLLMPFWGNFKPALAPEGGIWTYYYPGDANTPESFTIEWRVMTSPGTEPMLRIGNFQLRLIKRRDQPSDPSVVYSDIEYLYDLNNQITLTMPTALYKGYPGAVVGMKNEGQGIGHPGPDGSGIDDSRLLIIPPPLAPFTSYTRLPTRQQMPGPNTPDWYAHYPLNVDPFGGPSLLFHYGFPNVTYQIKPVESDVLAVFDRGPVFTQDSMSNNLPTDPYYITPHTNIWLAARFANGGFTSLQNIPVHAIIYRDTAALLTLSSTIANLRAEDTATVIDTVQVVFPGPLDSSVTAHPGTYRVVVFSDFVNDGNRGNDTISYTFHIRDSIDAGPSEIVSPKLRPGHVRDYYTIGVPVPVAGRFLNSGMSGLNGVRVGYQVRDINGTVVRRDSAVVGNWDTMEVKPVEFQPWTPEASGSYQVELFTALREDQVPDNDTLREPVAGMVRKGGLFSSIPTPQYIVGVLPAQEIEITAPQLAPHEPMMNGIYRGSDVPITIYYRNNGSTDATNVPATVTIRNAAKTQVYNRSTVIPFIGEGYGIAIQDFPVFNPTAPGVYTLEANITSTNDATPGNDMATWTFTVDAITGVDAPYLPATGAACTLSVVPNPASRLAVIGYENRSGREGTLALYDLYGRNLRTLRDGELNRSGAISINLDDLASGVYAVRLVLVDGSTVVTRLVVAR